MIATQDDTQILLGDCLQVMLHIPDNHFDAIVTDPPAGIEFMGKDWDSPWHEGFTKHGFSDSATRLPAPTQRLSTRNPMCKKCHKHVRGSAGCQCETPDPDEDAAFVHRSRLRQRDSFVAWMTAIASECFRILKPGGHALVWALPRTSHWTATAWEDAGFEVRDSVFHIFGTGFPKSLDVGKAIDKAAGAEREVGPPTKWAHVVGDLPKDATTTVYGRGQTDKLTDDPPATDAAKQWDGWGTALKPAAEVWWLLRKPLSESTVAANVLKWGTGAINVDACRVETGDNLNSGAYCDGKKKAEDASSYVTGVSAGQFIQPSGRWPANVTHDGSNEVLEGFPDSKSNGGCGMASQKTALSGNVYCGGYSGAKLGQHAGGLGDSGSAARFFYCAKASRSDRGPDNKHPTAKNTKLMEWLIKLITPPGGIILDPFMGSGSTLVAAKRLGFRSVGIEQEPEHVEQAKLRVGEALKSDGLLFDIGA